MNYIMMLIGALGLGLLWTRIKSYFLGAKSVKLKTELQELRDEANKKVGAAESVDTEFQRKLQQYRDSKRKQ